MKWIFLLIAVLFLTGCAAADAGNAFPQDEAGICAYVNIGESIDLENAIEAYTQLLELSSTHAIGTIPISNKYATDNIHVYIDVDTSAISADNTQNEKDNFEEATSLNLGETIAGTIDVPGEMDTYTFSASSEDSLLIRMRSSWYDGPEIKLYAPNGTLISHATGSSNYFSEITQILPDTGEYTILAGDDEGDNTGNYSIFIQRINNPGNAIPIGFGENKSDSIDIKAEMDTYTFSASSEDSLLIRMRSSWYDGPEIKLYAPNGTLISHATGSSNYFSEITQILPDTGEYTILAGDDEGDNTGNYSIFIQRINNPGNAIPICFGENKSDSIDIKAEMDTYTFSASSEDSLLIRMRSSWYDGPEIKLYAPNGTLISHATGSSNYFSEITQILPDTGEYTILAGDDEGDDTGNYGFFIQRINNPGNAIPIGFGENKSDSIDIKAEMDTYTFSASSEDSLLIRMRSSWYDGPEIKLYAPNGTLISHATGSSNYFSEITQILPDTGEYTILAGDDEGDNTGNYSIFIQRINNPGNAIPICFGENKSDSIDIKAEMDTYTFSASSEDSLLIRMRSSWYDGPEIKLYAPNGTLISHATGSSNYFSEITQILPDTGEYTILAGDDEGDDTGNYGFFIQRINNPGNAIPIGFGENKSDSIDIKAEMDTYTFSASSEDSLLIRMRSSWYDGPEIKLYAPNGTLISHATGSSNYFSEITQILPDTGEYTILAGDDEGDDTGNYGFFIQRINNPGNAIPIGFGENKSDSIDIKAEMDTYTFSASSEDSLLIRMRSSWYDGPEIKLYAPNGTLISHATGSSNYFSEITQILPDTGEYTILAGDDEGDDTGNYGFFIQRINNPGNAIPIGFGENKSDSIDIKAEMDTYTFSASSEDSLLIRMRSSWYDGPEIKLYAPNGTLISHATGSSNYFSEITQILPDTGEYTILAGDDEGDDTGNYGIFIQSVQGICGDIDGNCMINIMDVRLLMNNVSGAGYPVDPWTGNVDGDGDIDGDDVWLLVRHVFDPDAYLLNCTIR